MNTIGENARAVQSYKRRELSRAREKASFDYLLADLIGASIARIYSSKNSMPPIEESYPTLFDTEEVKQIKKNKKMELSAIRFKQFAQSHNSKFKEVGKEK